MKKFVIVYRNDARVIGTFDSAGAAEAWVTSVPNILFATREEEEHADENSDYWVAELETV